MTTQIRISKLVIAALLGGGVSAGNLIVPNASHAQAVGGGPAVISLEVKQQIPGRRRVIGCDLLINVQNLPPGATIEFTDLQGKTRHLGPGITCLSGQLAGPPAPIVIPPGGPTTTCITTTDHTPTTICH